MRREDIERIGRMHYQATLDRKLIMPPSYEFPDINYEDAYAIASDDGRRVCKKRKTSIR